MLASEWWDEITTHVQIGMLGIESYEFLETNTIDISFFPELKINMILTSAISALRSIVDITTNNELKLLTAEQ